MAVPLKEMNRLSQEIKNSYRKKLDYRVKDNETKKFDYNMSMLFNNYGLYNHVDENKIR